MKLSWFILVAAGTAVSQSQSPVSSPQFDVAAVKPNTGVERGVQIDFPSPGRFHAENVWLRFLVQNAWNVRAYQVVSGAAWAASDRYDIDAKTDRNASREEMRLMLQSLLQDRFRLVRRHETRSLPVYHLIAASKAGSKLQPAETGSCVERNSDPASTPNSPQAIFCGSSEWSPHTLIGNAITMPQFTTMLENILRRPVIDETGFTARFNVRLNWVADQVTPGLMAPGVPPPPAPSPNDAGPTIFTALAEHLGIRIQTAKGPVDILVIVGAEKPSAN
jgi:uncharacterized protein (TIGR03435 family)